MLLRRSRDRIDPMATLAVQWRLSRLACEIRRLETDGSSWAKAHHLRAAEIAYDDLLAEACELVGIPAPVAAPPVRRLIMESDLRVRGWTW
jgi:hypothetical protein